MKKKILGVIAGIIMLFLIFMKNSDVTSKSIFKSTNKIAKTATPYKFKNTLKLSSEDMIGMADGANKVRDLHDRVINTTEDKTMSYGSLGLGEALRSNQPIKNIDVWYHRELSAAENQQNYAYKKELISDKFLDYLNEQKRHLILAEAYEKISLKVRKDIQSHNDMSAKHYMNSLLLNLNDRDVTLHVDEIEVLKKELLILINEENKKRAQNLTEEKIDLTKNSKK